MEQEKPLGQKITLLCKINDAKGEAILIKTDQFGIYLKILNLSH